MYDVFEQVDLYQRPLGGGSVFLDLLFDQCRKKDFFRGDVS